MTQDNYHIYSNRVFIDGDLQPASLSIANGKISAIHLGVQLNDVINYEDRIIMPGVIDAHVHINEPGRTIWEGFETATKAAARGGITTLVDMPLNSSPVVTNVAAFQEKLVASQGKLYVNCGFWAGATDASIESVKALVEKGCLGVKVFLSHSGIDEFPNIALDDLGNEHPFAAQLVKLRYFGGMTQQEAAECLAISRSPAHRYWVYAKAALFSALEDSGC